MDDRIAAQIQQMMRRIEILEARENVVASQDAFQRTRVSLPSFRADGQFTYDKLPLVFEETTSGTGVATHNANERVVYLSTGGTASGALSELQLNYYIPYTPGRSQLIFITGTLDVDGVDFTNAKSQMGYMDDDNGVFLQYDSDGAKIIYRTKISGTVVDTEYLQADWNRTTASDVDWSTSQIFVIDLQALYVGRIRTFLDRNGILVPLHFIQNDNTRASSYWQIASLPVRWRVENTGTANATARMVAICSSGISEGGDPLLDMPGVKFGIDTGTTGIATSTTLIPLLSIRPKTTFNSLTNRGLVIPEFFKVFSSNNPALYRVLLNPTLTGALFTSANVNSLVEYDVTASAVSGGTQLSSDFVAAAKNTANTTVFEQRVPLSLDRAGTTGDIITIAAVRIGTTDASLHAAIDWREIR